MTRPALLLAVVAVALSSPVGPMRPAPAPAERRVPAAEAVAVPVAEMARVDAGTYRPLYETSAGAVEVPVAAFDLAVQPVTNAEFLAFVRANPSWQRSAVAPLFAEAGYLREWAGDTALGPEAPPASPVVNVSWFAARAYAAWAGARLPTTDEWEYAASASATQADGRADPAFVRATLARYGRPMPRPLPAVGQGTPNVWGVRDLHGLVWEWTADTASALVTSDSRQSADADSRRFCAAGAVGASDFQDYAAFLRTGFRGGLEAHFTVPNLGFRIARDAANASV